MMNYRKTPWLTEIQRLGQLRSESAADYGLVERQWQADIDDVFKSTDFSVKVSNELLQELYMEKLNSVNSQESYDKVFHIYYRSKYLTINLICKAKHYFFTLRRSIEEIDTPNSICPCCGNPISEEFICKMREQLTDIENQIDFYEVFLDLREKELKMLQERATRRGFILHQTACLEELKGEKL